MIRNLKVLLAAALALTAFGAIAGSAHAADEFHCSVQPCRLTLRADGTGKTAHHVFVLENETTSESVSFTCESLTGEGEASTFIVNELTATNLVYHGCTINGAAGMEVKMNGCDFKAKTLGGTTGEAKLGIVCPPEKKVEFVGNGCVISIAGGFEAGGIGYANVGTSPSRQATASVNHVTIPGSNISVAGTQAQCSINPSQKLVATYITGNTLVTGETTAGVMADAWYE